MTNHEMRETVKELSQIDGAFIIANDGTIEAAGRYITIDTSQASIPKGLGTRHASVAGITQETRLSGSCSPERGKDLALQGRKDLPGYYREGISPKTRSRF